MIKLILTLIAFLYLNAFLYSANSNLPGAFIEELVGARAIALGGAYTVLSNDPLAMIYNPASLHKQSDRSTLLVEHSQVMQFWDYSYIGFGKRLSPGFSAGLGLMHSGDEIMSESICYLTIATDLSSIASSLKGNIIPEDMLTLGLSMKYYFSSFGEDNGTDYFDFSGNNHKVSGTASGFGFDAGLNLSLTSKDHLGTTFKNIGNLIYWNSRNKAGTAEGKYQERVPLSWKVGYARVEERFRAAIDISKGLYLDVEDGLYVGIEYNLLPDLMLRGGYSQELVTADNKRIMTGIGIKIPAITLIEVSITYQTILQWENHNSVMVSIKVPLGR